MAASLSVWVAAITSCDVIQQQPGAENEFTCSAVRAGFLFIMRVNVGLAEIKT